MILIHGKDYRMSVQSKVPLHTNEICVKSFICVRIFVGMKVKNIFLGFGIASHWNMIYYMLCNAMIFRWIIWVRLNIKVELNMTENLP